MENETSGAAKKRRLNESSDDAEMHSEENMQEQLRQFDVLDEVHGDESGSEGSDGTLFFLLCLLFFFSIILKRWQNWILVAVDCGTSESDLDDIDIENMLDEGLPEDLRDHKKQQHYEEKYKTIMDGN